MSVIPFESEMLPQPQIQFPTLREATGKSLFDLNDQFLPVGKGFENVANLEINNLATPANVKKLQDQANDLAKKLYKESTWRGLTLRNAVSDMSEAITGIFSDIYKNSGKVSVGDIFMKNNRLRGIGLIFILVALAAFAFR